MAQVSSLTVMTELLQQYRDYPCLWNTSHSLYSNNQARKQAYVHLLKIYRQLVEDANMHSLKKKIDNLRTSYRREAKKVQKDSRYVPNLWYYSHLEFLDEGSSFAENQSTNEDEVNPDVNIGAFEIESEVNNYSMNTEMKETEAFGRTIGLQLNELSSMQKTIAEKLISDVIFNARLEKLTTKTTLVNLNDDYV